MSRREKFSLVLSEEEKTWLVLLSDREGGLSLAAMIRRLIRSAAQAYKGLPPLSKPDVSKEMPK